MGADFVACDFCVVCCRGLPTTTNPSTGTRERIFARNKRERESFYTLSLSPYLLIVSVDLLETSKIEKKKLPRRPHPFFFFCLSFIPQSITILTLGWYLVYHFSFLSNRIRERSRRNKSNLENKKKKDLRLFIADSSEKYHLLLVHRVGRYPIYKTCSRRSEDS